MGGIIKTLENNENNITKKKKRKRKRIGAYFEDESKNKEKVSNEVNISKPKKEMKNKKNEKTKEKKKVFKRIALSMVAVITLFLVLGAILFYSQYTQQSEELKIKEEGFEIIQTQASPKSLKAKEELKAKDSEKANKEEKDISKETTTNNESKNIQDSSASLETTKDNSASNNFPSVENITIGQYNILKPDDTSHGSWSSRSQGIAQTMNNSNADIISLNELYEGYQEADIESMTNYEIIHPYGSEPYGWSEAIAYDTSSISLVKYGTYFFKNQFLYQEGSLKGKTASRTAVWGLFEKNDKRFILISGHTQVDRDGDANEKQIEELKSLANSLSQTYGTDNVFVAGDLNENGYSNSKCNAPIVTYPANGLSYDYICSKSSTVNNVKSYNNNYSDHIMITADVKIYK